MHQAGEFKATRNWYPPCTWQDELSAANMLSSPKANWKEGPRNMFLLEIFLPTFDNDGQKFAKEKFDTVRAEMIEAFGGVTAFTRSPASGLWSDDAGKVRHDDMAILEVMTETLDKQWWRGYRKELEQRFKQELIVIRASEFQQV